MLTNAVVKAAQPGPRPYKMFDANGLHLFVATSGTKSWRLKYRRGGKEQLLTLGQYPALGVHEARARCAQAKDRIGQGLDPSAKATPDTFEALARAWHTHQAGRWSPAHAQQVLDSLEADIFPELGAATPSAISSAELLKALRAIEARGCSATARRVRQRLSAIFGYGMSCNLCDSDPAAVIGRAMGATGLVTPHAALTSIEDCRALLLATDHLVADTRMVRLASRFLALTAVRLDAVRGMRWDEVEQLDGAEPLWRVPPERMKLAKAKKAEERFAHLVPLSAPAASILHELRRANLHRDDTYMHHRNADCGAVAESGLVFPGRSPTRPFGENAIRTLYIAAGYQGRHVPHGWRASFSTILNEALGPDWRADIDRALAHVPTNKVEAAYNRAEQLGRRRALFDRWGAMLTDNT